MPRCGSGSAASCWLSTARNGRRRAARRLAAHPGDYRAYVALGVALDLSCDQRQAQQVYRDGVRHDPGNPSLRNNLAVSLALAGDDDEAIVMLRELSRELGAGPRVRQNLALVYALAGRAEDAAAMAQRDLPARGCVTTWRAANSLRGMNGPRLAADVVCGGEPGNAVLSRVGPDASSSVPVAFGERALARQDAVLPVAAVTPIADDASRMVAAAGRPDAASSVASAGGVPATGRSGIGATKIKSAVEGGVLAALENADESAGSPGDAPAASYAVPQGDTLSLIAKKYYGNGRKYLARMEANGPRSPSRTRSMPAWWCASRRWLRMPTLARGQRAGRVAGATTSATATIPAEFGAHDQVWGGEVKSQSLR